MTLTQEEKKERKREYRSRYRETPQGKASRKRYRERNREKSREYQREYRRTHLEENRKYLKEYMRAYGQTKKQKYATYKRSAKSRGHEFELYIDTFLTYWQKPCHYCGEDIETIGLDRVDNSSGYTVENTVPCCFGCNKIKQAMTLEDFLNKISAIYKHSIKAN